MDPFCTPVHKGCPFVKLHTQNDQEEPGDWSGISSSLTGWPVPKERPRRHEMEDNLFNVAAGDCAQKDGSWMSGFDERKNFECKDKKQLWSCCYNCYITSEGSKSKSRWKKEVTRSKYNATQLDKYAAIVTKYTMKKEQGRDVTLNEVSCIYFVFTSSPFFELVLRQSFLFGPSMLVFMPYLYFC